ncbi:putative N6-adenine methyltransferase-domain-containing protein [Venturia nashicola]|nr:putative N6-adenine methyltransferase-domain-containing protein [Venturia nashicola]
MSNPDPESDSEPELSTATLTALQQFYTEKESHQKAFEDLKAAAENDFDPESTEITSLKYPLSMTAFTEDWNASQFWYTTSTATTLAHHLLQKTTSTTRICVISAPSVFLQLKNLIHAGRVQPAQLLLLEFDRRFEVFGSEFQHYDFREPVKLPGALRGRFDVFVVDPPFLSEECQTRTALTVRWLARSWEGSGIGGVGGVREGAGGGKEEGLKMVVCTGERMEGLICKLYKKVGVRTTDFVVEHAKGLSNEFRCYANFECEEWKFVDGVVDSG